MLFAGAAQAHGHKGPAEIPAKRAFTYRFVVWQAKQLGIAAQVSAGASVQSAAAVAARRSPATADPDVVQRIFRFVWRDGRLADLPIEWAELMHELDMPDADARIASPEVKDALRRNTDEAIARGVFGVPTLAIGDALFWGADATAMVADYIAQGCRFADPEMARVADLPVGVEREAAKRNAK